MVTETINLAAGLPYNNKRQKACVMRSPIVKDSIEAEEESQGKGVLHLSLSLISKAIVSFGDIPKEEITADLLMGLEESDLERLQEAREFLKKKIHWSNAG